MSDIFDSLLAAIDKQVGVETIDGNDVRQIAKDHVMLDVAFTPVLPDRLHCDPATGFLGFVPTPCRVQKEGERYCVWLPEHAERYRWTSVPELQVMRARYLLLRGWYFKIIENMPDSERNEVVSKFFPGGCFKPQILMEEK